VFLKVKLLAYVLLATQAVCAQEVRIGVLGLFRTHEITLRTSPTQSLIVRAGNESFVLERSNGHDIAKITASGNELTLQVGDRSVRTSAIRAASRSDGVTDFVLAIPGKISRQYHGVLDVKAAAGALVSVVTMELETAVASAVQAESAPDTPLEALKAQAVATRSYFVAARGRHHDFDFCDTTHCQFLREPPPPDSDAFRAAVATRGLVLAYRDQAVTAMFSRSCGGRTRTPGEVGLSNHGYPYFSVACEYRIQHPSRWTRRVSQAEAGDLLRRGEPSRLEIDRRLGWDAVPSNNFTAHGDEHGVVLEGAGQGHGIGLCQRGAKAMAQSGAGFHQILDHYYPNTALISVDPGTNNRLDVGAGVPPVLREAPPDIPGAMVR
jgi:peptidoglycan hydrolase-like amidase